LNLSSISFCGSDDVNGWLSDREDESFFTGSDSDSWVTVGEEESFSRDEIPAYTYTEPNSDDSDY
jgi:hypothetical protein